MKIKTSLLTITAAVVFLLPLPAQTTTPSNLGALSEKSNTSQTIPTLDQLKATYDNLKLTSSQKKKLAVIVQKYKSTVNYQVNLVIQDRRKLRTIINTVPTNESAVRAQSSVVAGAETELAVTRAKISSDVQAVLTTEQISQLKTAQAKIYKLVDTLLARIRSFFASI